MEIFNDLNKPPEGQKEVALVDIDHEGDRKYGFTDHKRYQYGSGKDFIDTMKRDNHYEIHHMKDTPENGWVSGQMHHSSDMNIPFVHAILHHATKLLDAGHSIKVVGLKGVMFNHYHRLAKSLAKRNNLSISSPKDYDINDPIAHEYSMVTLRKND